MKRMQPYLKGIWYSLPLQLFLLHLKKYQVLLFFWLILFATVNGSFLYRLGAHMLFLYPEYLGSVDFFSTLIVGVALGIFVMSWNITTFILHSRHVAFLATTTQPFLKYCFNNAVLPLVFLIFYLVKAVQFDRGQELLSYGEIFILVGGFSVGLFLALFVAFSWFFGADRTIYRYGSPGARAEIERMKQKLGDHDVQRKKGLIKVDWYLTPAFRLRKPRDTRHYSSVFIERLFKQHHLSAMLSVMLAFASLLIIGYFLDHKVFQVPAAASIIVIFAILIAVAGAVAYFLGQWTIPFVILVFIGLNWLYQHKILDPRNKAYGLNYSKTDSLARYDRDNLLAISPRHQVVRDSLAFIETLEVWKAKQSVERPVMVVVCLSGGGIRSATFAAQVLHQLDSITRFGFIGHTTLMTGASGGMMGAAWYRELYLRYSMGSLKENEIAARLEQISVDLLNPVFSSFAARDLIAPPRKFTYKGSQYIKDRGYAFEQQLSENTGGWLDRSLSSYLPLEEAAIIPTMFLNAVITLDGRALTMSTRPVRFMMRPLMDSTMGPLSDADAVCYQSLFAARQPGSLRFLTALRMNATFPYVLPNVWLPTRPIIDVMDAGFRDNSGIETSLKFLYTFREWVKANCSKVVLVEIRDKPQGGWAKPFESKSVIDLVTKPALLTQNNLFRYQEYLQLRQLEWFRNIMGDQFERVVFEYLPTNKEYPASLSFHLTQREKIDLKASLAAPPNQRSFQVIDNMMPDPE